MTRHPTREVLVYHPPDPVALAEQLTEREGMIAEKRIGWVRIALLAIALLVFMPLRYPGSTQGLDPSFGLDLGLFGGFLAIALGMATVGRGRLSVRLLSRLAVLLDFGFLGVLIAIHAWTGLVTVSGKCLAQFDMSVYFGVLMATVSGIRMSPRQVKTAGLAALGLVAEAACLDVFWHHVPLNLPLLSLQLMLALGSSGAAWLMVSKTRDLIQETAQIELKAAKVHAALSRYVSEQAVETILGDEFTQLGGKRMRVTVLFSDIRGFTQLSERLLPEEVVALLNSYFSSMVEAVFAHDGMLDKFIGDGMMVVFGAPMPQEDHAWRAVQAALQMRAELEKLNVQREHEGLAMLKIGIGLHTGEVVVGNIGTERRLDYTAIGDAVNTASRIESLTKEHGVDILMSAETHAELGGRVSVRPVMDVAIRGKASRLDLFILEGLVGEKPPMGPAVGSGRLEVI